MDKVVSKIAGLDVAGLVLIILMSTSGVAGAAAITYVLALLGGPFGMLGGIVVLGIIAMAATAIAEHGIDAIARGVVKNLKEKGKSKQEIISEIDKFPIISKRLKALAKSYVD